MKKHFYAFVSVLLVLPAAQGQITITDTDMPVVNDTFRLSITSDQWSIDPAATGTSHTWDFSFFTPESQEFDTCKDVSTLPPAYQFYFNNAVMYPSHKADFAIRGQDFDFGTMFSMTNVHDFYKKGSTKYQNVGFGANLNGVPASVRKNPIETVYSLPMNYGDVFSNYSKFSVEVPGTGEYKQKKYKDAEVDGWGTLMLPIGSFPVLRMKIHVRIIDSIYIDGFGMAFETQRPTQTEYHWLTQNKDVPLLVVTTDSATGTVTRIAYQDAYQPIAGTGETGEEISFNVYPNPVSDGFTVQSPEPVLQVRVYDVYGRTVLEASPGSTRFTVAIPGTAANGTYVVECTGRQGLQRQKLVVQH